MMKQNFDRKIYTGSLFLSDIGFLLSKAPKIIKMSKNKDINKAFVEKIMSVTTAVNGCTYCEWFHAKQALDSGISEDEIKNMMKLQFEADASDFEIMALLYAQHYAETNRKPSAEMTEKLFNFYGDKTANDILLNIRMILVGNLSGNTWDAILSRFKGMPAKGSNILFEFIFFVLTFWVMFPMMWLMKKETKAKNNA
jgi:AhpD family alkylhydroperoxidase